MKRVRLGIVATHPIQYQVPWFQALAARPELELKVYFGMLPDSRQQGIGFGVPFQWDIPMREGYVSEVLGNRRRDPRLGTFFGSIARGIRDALRRDRREAMLLTGWNAFPLLQALGACISMGIPRIVRGESNALRARPAWVRRAHRLLLARYDAFLAIGKANRAFYLGNGVPESRVFMAPYFVDNARFAAAATAQAPQRAALRASWGIADRAACFLFAGKLEPKKRILDLIAAVGRARLQAQHAHLLVAGAGDLMGEAQALAAREGIAASFAGFLNQTELPAAYAAADCLVLPSDFGETWGLVVNEAMACGLPAVVSDRVGCGADLVEDGVTGRVFPFGDVDALAGVVRSLAQSPARLAEMGRRARAHVAGYSVEAAVQGTLDAVRYATRQAH